MGRLADVPGIRVGHATVPGGGSGCTVVLGPFRARVLTPGHASGSREMATLAPAHVARHAHALLLTGGSAFGLAAADGVMSWLEARGVGFATSAGVVPIVPAAVIFDLAPERARPGPDEGAAACEDAEARAASTESELPADPPRVGAGRGARVGKLLGPEASMPGGLGESSARVGEYRVGALAVVNALGDVTGAGGEVVAGARPDPDAPPVRALDHLLPGENTTLAVVATDAPLTPADLERFLTVAATALPRTIDPVFTPFDGDVIFGVVPEAAGVDPLAPEGTPRAPVEVLSLAVAARRALERAIWRAVGVDDPALPPNPASP
jgi:L-aminopeptidase/D-esterase-like protein